jgi:Icc-related predicted phosphoesterase
LVASDSDSGLVNSTEMTKNSCFFACDLHGSFDRYRALLALAEEERPRAVFLGGDLLPHHRAMRCGSGGLIAEIIEPGVRSLRKRYGDGAPVFYLILGNDDDRVSEEALIDGDRRGLWIYAHERWSDLDSHPVLGYAYVPPTPFLLKDWERYDVSRSVDPGCVSPEEGQRTVPVDPDVVRYGTIAADLERLSGDRELDRAIFLFHSPPYRTVLDRAGLDGKSVDHVPLDVHVGSIAIQRFIEARQPLLTLHGHIHEAPRLTGEWRVRIGRTHCFTAAHDGPELALVRFDLDNLDNATRELV